MRKLSHEDISKVIKELSSIVTDIDSLDSGKGYRSLIDALGNVGVDVNEPRDILNFFNEMRIDYNEIFRMFGFSFVQGMDSGKTYIVYSPTGVKFTINPYNHTVSKYVKAI